MALADLLPGDRRYDELARFYVAAGELARAQEMLAEARANDRIIGRDLKAERSWTRGVLALAQGRVAEAVTELETAGKLQTCPICPLPDLGRALEASGRIRDAAAVYRRYLTTPWMWRYEPDAVELGWTTQRLAELQERLGEPQATVATYSRLLDLWREADPPLQGILTDMRRRIAAVRDANPER
jgi:tetratricopeptide (TPR) repeat protein